MSERPVRFVILAAPRTGSNLLCTLLDSHPDILCHHELFNPAGVFWALEARENGSSSSARRELRDRDPRAFLSSVWNAHGGHKCVGFKMTGRQHPGGLGAAMEDRGVRKIVLRRRNRVRTYVSRLIAERTGVWELYDGNPVQPPPAVTVDPDELRAMTEEDDAFYAELEAELHSTQQSCLRVTYERLFEVEERARALEFLDLRGGRQAARRLSTPSLRRLPDEPREVVANLPALSRALEGTELATDLDPAHWAGPVENGSGYADAP